MTARKAKRSRLDISVDEGDTLSIWVKTKCDDNPSLVICEANLMVAQFLQHLISINLSDTLAESKANNLILSHAGSKIQHDMRMKDISDITLDNPLIVEAEDNCKCACFSNTVIVYCIS